MTATETTRLSLLESVIERGFTTYLEVGSALREIRETKLYRETHKTFEVYCRQRWGWSRSYANRLIRAALLVKDLVPMGTKPENERQARALYSSDSTEWYTPSEIIERTERLLGAISLDPCSDADKSVPADAHYTKAEDGLTKGWHGTVYMNPPYGDEILGWVDKLCAEYGRGNVTEAIALVPARVDTQWFSRLRDFAVCFIHGRLKFSGHENSAPFPSAVIYLGRRRKDFLGAFGDLGDVWVRYGEI